jgi:ABC-2 type transport system ATP-binding protein
MNVLELEHVTKLFGGDFRAVDDVSFAVREGTITGFLGPNGAGKTTTLRMILGILKPTSGRIAVFGAPSALDVRERIGYLPEEKGLYKKMKCWAIVAYFATLKGVERREAKKRAYALLERYGLKDFADKRTEALSKGMGQKVQVLASIAHDPELVILDEPFSGLDPTAVDSMADLLRDETARGVPVLFSSHQLDLVERLCDHLVVLAGGRVVAQGSVDDLRARGTERLRLVTDRDAGWVRDEPGVHVVDVDGPTAVVEVDGADPSAVRRRLLTTALDRGDVVELVRVVTPLSEIYREVTA